MGVTPLRTAVRTLRGFARRFRPELSGWVGNGPGVPWPDRGDAEERLRRKLADGIVSAEDAERLRFWMANGYVILKGAVPHTVLDRFERDVEQAWTGREREIHVEYWQDHTMHIAPIRPELKSRQAKVLDLHGFSEAARDAVFSAAIVRFLGLVFERPSLAFQSLYFERGTQQPMHQDAAYVVVNAPLEMAASWIAVEDIRPDTGELEYYAGSHRLRPYLFRGVSKSLPDDMPVSDPDHERFLVQLHEQAAAMGLERMRFRPSRGDALIWHPDLVHGGSQEMDPDSSRKSLVTHYCPIDRAPRYFRTAAHTDRLPHTSGCAYAYQLRGPNVRA